MKKIVKIIFITMAIVLILSGIVVLKFKIWRAAHPQAETWTFYIPKNNK